MYQIQNLTEKHHIIQDEGLDEVVYEDDENDSEECLCEICGCYGRSNKVDKITN
jgi:hypothetical protein